MKETEINMRELRSEQVAKKYGLSRLQKRLCDEYISLFSNPHERATLANASRRIGCHEDYGKKQVRKPGVTEYIDEMMRPDMNAMYQVIDDVINRRIKDPHVVTELQGDGTSKAVVVETDAPAKVIADTANTFIRICKDNEWRMQNVRSKQKDQMASSTPEFEGEIIDVNQATLDALLGRQVEGFDDKDGE